MMKSILRDIEKSIFGLAQDCAEIEEKLEQDPLDSEASQIARDLLRKYLNDVLSYLSACVHLLKTEEILEASVDEKLSLVKQILYGSSEQIIKECFDQIESCKERKEKEIKRDDFTNTFIRKVFENLKKFTELLHTYSYPSDPQKEAQVSQDTYNAIIESVRKLSERTAEISTKIQALIQLHEKTNAEIEESQETLREFFALRQQGYKDPDLFQLARQNITAALKK